MNNNPVKATAKFTGNDAMLDTNTGYRIHVQSDRSGKINIKIFRTGHEDSFPISTQYSRVETFLDNWTNIRPDGGR